MEINKIDKSYWAKIFGIFLITTLPLLNLPPLFFPPPWAQATVFKTTFIFLLCFLIKDLLLKPGYFQEIKNKILAIPFWVSVPLVSYLILVIISTIFSLQPTFSFWGSPYRGDGSLNLILYILFAFYAYIIVKKENWKKIWIFAFAIGCMVSLVAFAQQFRLLPESILVPYSDRPPSTLGNTNFLSAYLGLLIFISFAYAIKEKIFAKKIFYWVVSAIFLSTIVLTLSRSAFLGIIAGSLWMIFFCRIQKPAINKAKNIVGISLLVLMCLAVIYVNNAKIPQFVEKNYLLNTLYSRLVIDFSDESRFASWKTILPGLGYRPFLGTGPENFSIVFDKYYDPVLTKINSAGGQWWDRAHNTPLEIALTTGIPSLLIYLFFWTTLFVFLQKNKKNNFDSYWILHSIQATIIAYLVINFFGFDCPPTYIFSFMLAGYSFIFIAKISLGAEKQNFPVIRALKIKKIFVTVIFIIAIFFIWQYVLVPWQINEKINWANYYLDKEKNCLKAYERLNPISDSNLYINTYVRQVYASIIAKCATEENDADKKNKLIKEGIEVSERIIQQRPYYTKSWIYLGILNGNLLEKNPEDISLQEKTDFYFKKASELSPKRIISLYEWGKAYLASGNCQKSLDIGNQCVAVDANSADCLRLLAISNLCLGNDDLYEKQSAEADTKEIGSTGTDYLKYTAKIYSRLLEKNGPRTSYYLGLEKIYIKLVQIHSENIQYRTSLANLYKILGKYKEAKEQAMVIFGLSPELKADVMTFIESLPYSPPASDGTEDLKF